jgi:hypothetical protein
MLTKIVFKWPRITLNCNLTDYASYLSAYDFEHVLISSFDNSFIEAYLPSFSFRLKVIINLNYLFIVRIIN